MKSNLPREPKPTEVEGAETSTANLHTQFQRFLHRQAEHNALKLLSESNTARRVELEQTCNLEDNEALDELARCLVISNLLVTRISNREEAIATAEQELLAAGNAFVSAHLGPRVRKLQRLAEIQVRNQLRPHYQASPDLDRAVRGSDIVRKYEGLAWMATCTSNPQNGMVKYVEDMLVAWKTCDTYESELL